MKNLIQVLMLLMVLIFTSCNDNVTISKDEYNNYSNLEDKQQLINQQTQQLQMKKI